MKKNQEQFQIQSETSIGYQHYYFELEISLIGIGLEDNSGWKGLQKVIWSKILLNGGCPKKV